MICKIPEIYQLTGNPLNPVTSLVSVYNTYTYYIDLEKRIFALIPFPSATMNLFCSATYLYSLHPTPDNIFNADFNKWRAIRNDEGKRIYPSFRTLLKSDLESL